MHGSAFFASIVALALTAVFPASAEEANDRPPDPGRGEQVAELHGSGAPSAELVTRMGRLQYFVHKLGLAVSAGNRPLQAFYLHEAEEVVEAVERIEKHDGIEIAGLLRQNLIPSLETLKTEVQTGNGSRIDSAYESLLAGCNACHKAAGRPYIQIRRRTDNPYMQDFAPAP